MKFLIAIILSTCVVVAKPKKELSKYVLKNKLFMNYVEGVGYKVILKKFDSKNKSVFEISSFLKGDESHYLFTTDSLYGNGSSPEYLNDFEKLKYAVIEMNRIDTLKEYVKRWEQRIFTKEQLNAVTYQEFVFTDNLKVKIEFFNKQDLYYDTVNSDFNFEKGTKVYLPSMSEAVMYCNGRKHTMSYQEFKRTFELTSEF
jgi:hypothetical protein